METKTKAYLIGGGVLAAGALITFLVARKKVKLKKGINNYSKTSIPSSGINLTELAQQLAMDLGTAYSWYDPRHATENDDDAVKDILKVPKTMIPAFMKIYADKYKSNVQQDLQRLLPADGWNEVKYLFA
jgi:hypothetical protein